MKQTKYGVFLATVAVLLFFGSTTVCAQDDMATAWRGVVEVLRNNAPAEERIKVIEGFLEKHGDSNRASTAAFMAARIYIDELDQPAKGVALLERMRSKAKTEREKIDSTHNLIWAYGRAGDVTSLKAFAAELTKSGDINPTFHSSIGGAAMDAKDYALAAGHLQKAYSEATPEWYRKHYTNMSDDRVAEHRKWFMGRTLSELGAAYLHIKQYADAEEAFAKAAKESRSNVVGIYNNDNQLLWARTLKEQGKTEAAIEKLLVPAILQHNKEAEELLKSLFHKKNGASGDYTAFVKAKQKTLAVAAPDFTLSDYKGNSVSLSSYKGKVVMLNFWFPT